MNNDPINKTDDAYKVAEVTKVFPRNRANKTRNRKKKRDRKQHDEAGSHFDRLAEAADHAHSILVQSHSPYRFCVYKQNNDVYVDLILLDDEGKTLKIIKKNITHQQFTTWLERIENGDGLIFDKKV